MKKLLILFVSLLGISSAMAQKTKLYFGDLSALKGQKAIALEFSYDNMRIGMKGDKSEQQYIDESKKKQNEKEPGKGDQWEQQWIGNRKDRFEPKFRELFAKRAEMTTTDAGAKYTLIFKTVKTEPGFNVGVMRRPAFIDGEAWIVETANKSNIIAKMTVVRCAGQDVMGFDFDSGKRLEESYAKAGKEVGTYFTKMLK